MNRGLAWIMDIFGCADSALAWAFKHTYRSHYPAPPAFRMVHIPDVEPVIHSDPHPAMVDFDGDDYEVEASRVLHDAQQIPGIDWPMLEIAYSLDNNARLRAIEAVRDRIGQRYPYPYFQLVAYSWRQSRRVKPSLLVALSGKADRTEREWRDKIQGELAEALESALQHIERNA